MMGKVARISICIPVYNAEKTIDRCACSLFGQTIKSSLEFIFVNDGSIDSSRAVIDACICKHPEIRDQVLIIDHQSNRGLVAARQTAIAAATGDYVIHCDADDWVDADYYEKLRDVALSTDADIVCSGCTLDFPSGRSKIIRPIVISTPDELVLAMTQKLKYSSLVVKLVRRDIAVRASLDIPLELDMGEDLLRSVSMLNISQVVATCECKGYHYVQNPSSMCRTLNQDRLNQFIRVVELLTSKYGIDRNQTVELRKQVLSMALKYRCLNIREFRRYRASVRESFLNPIKNFDNFGWKRSLMLLLSDVSPHLAYLLSSVVGR